MRLAISNIAWKPKEREAVYAILGNEGVRGLEIAPAQTFPNEPDPVNPSVAVAAEFRREIDRHGFELVSMQSLLFGLKDAQLFGSDAQRDSFERGLARAVALAYRLGIPNLVLGSPANRSIPGSMSRADAERVAIEVFRRVGDLCLEAKTKLAIEPNPVAYGTNFLNTIGETLAFVKRIEHPAVSVNFDIGSLHMNGEMATGAEWFAKAGPFVSHVHVSEPNLAPAPQDVSLFEALAGEILAHGFGGWFSIEMRATGDDSLRGIAHAVRVCSRALSAAAQVKS